MRRLSLGWRKCRFLRRYNRISMTGSTQRATGPGWQSSGGPGVGVRIAGTGHYLPEHRVTNADLVKLMDTSDEWIVQRTGIHERRRRGPEETTRSMGLQALRRALADAAIDPREIDLVLCATMTPEMKTPATANMISAEIGAGHAGSMDINGACSGFVFGMNIAHELIKGGSYRTIALVGADSLSTLLDYSTAGRGTSILFGDGAGAAIFRATDDRSKGVLAQAMHSDGLSWRDIYVASRPEDFPPGVESIACKFNKVQMNGANVFKFAVGTFPKLIESTLAKAQMSPAEVDMYVCHQSNQRILHAARDRFEIPEHKMYVNIDRVGNTVGASVPICLDELRKAGRVVDGMAVMFLGFGAGLTWGSSLWRV
jgi:3-oxoacyl-[acyl-carrier-protein] synthase III